MAFGIVIYEKDESLFDLVKQRLSVRFPDAYVTMITNMNEENTNEEFYTDKKVIFDNKQFSTTDFEDNAVPLYDNNGVVNIGRIIENIRVAPVKINSLNSNSGSLTLLLPFVYISDREKYIHSNLSNLLNSDISLRLDYMAGYRMPNPSITGVKAGGFSTLLKAANNKSFDSFTLLNHCTCDTSGFITPGRPLYDDDVFDAGIDALLRLTSSAKELTRQTDKNCNALICAESLSSENYARIAALCDGVKILVPSRETEEAYGLDPLIAKLSKASQGHDIEIIYADELNKPEKSYEAVV